MSRRKKIFIICHLCFALSFLVWLLIQPYVREIVSQKSQNAVYEMVTSHSLFKDLPESEQEGLVSGYDKVKKQNAPSFLHECGRLFFISTPACALAWLFFSLAVSLLLLFQIEGAEKAAWLLPCIVLAYMYFSYTSAPKDKKSLFPSETYVLNRYVSSQEIEVMSQRKRLLVGWHRYLVAEWAKEEPSSKPEIFQQQLEKGLFAFNVARINWLQQGKGDEIVLAGFSTTPAPLSAIFYLLWNTGFAWMVRKEKKRSSEAQSAQTC
jgi:hypothetical protein